MVVSAMCAGGEGSQFEIRWSEEAFRRRWLLSKGKKLRSEQLSRGRVFLKNAMTGAKIRKQESTWCVPETLPCAWSCVSEGENGRR